MRYSVFILSAGRGPREPRRHLWHGGLEEEVDGVDGHQVLPDPLDIARTYLELRSGIANRKRSSAAEEITGQKLSNLHLA